MSSPEKDCWLDAMKKEMNSRRVGVGGVACGSKAVGSKWVFKTKTNADGKIERYKAGLVAHH